MYTRSWCTEGTFMKHNAGNWLLNSFLLEISDYGTNGVQAYVLSAALAWAAVVETPRGTVSTRPSLFVKVLDPQEAGPAHPFGMVGTAR